MTSTTFEKEFASVLGRRLFSMGKKGAPCASHSDIVLCENLITSLTQRQCHEGLFHLLKIKLRSNALPVLKTLVAVLRLLNKHVDERVSDCGNGCRFPLESGVLEEIITIVTEAGGEEEIVATASELCCEIVLMSSAACELVVNMLLREIETGMTSSSSSPRGVAEEYQYCDADGELLSRRRGVYGVLDAIAKLIHLSPAEVDISTSRRSDMARNVLATLTKACESDERSDDEECLQGVHKALDSWRIVSGEYYAKPLPPHVMGSGVALSIEKMESMSKQKIDINDKMGMGQGGYAASAKRAVGGAIRHNTASVQPGAVAVGPDEIVEYSYHKTTSKGTDDIPRVGATSTKARRIETMSSLETKVYEKSRAKQAAADTTKSMPRIYLNKDSIEASILRSPNSASASTNPRRNKSISDGQLQTKSPHSDDDVLTKARARVLMASSFLRNRHSGNNTRPIYGSSTSSQRQVPQDGNDEDALIKARARARVASSLLSSHSRHRFRTDEGQNGTTERDLLSRGLAEFENEVLMSSSVKKDTRMTSPRGLSSCDDNMSLSKKAVVGARSIPRSALADVTSDLASLENAVLRKASVVPGTATTTAAEQTSNSFATIPTSNTANAKGHHRRDNSALSITDLENNILSKVSSSDDNIPKTEGFFVNQQPLTMKTSTDTYSSSATPSEYYSNDDDDDAKTSSSFIHHVSDHGLTEAIPVSIRQLMPLAIDDILIAKEYVVDDGEGNGSFLPLSRNTKRLKKQLAVFGLLIVTAVIAMAILVPRHFRRKQVVFVDGGKEVAAPSVSPTMSPTDWRHYSIMEMLMPIAPLVRVRNSPQYLAKNWIVYDDPLQLSTSSLGSTEALIQRFVLAVFYFATGGEEWGVCGGYYKNGRNGTNCTYVEKGVEWTDSVFLSGVHECLWFGTLCDERRDDGIVRYLFLYANKLKGTIPTEIGHLNSLQHIWLNHNNITGPIPLELSTLPSLIDLQLHDNLFTGTLPEELMTMEQLMRLNVGFNNLQGAVLSKTMLGGGTSVSSLRGLHLMYNQFSGEVSRRVTKLGSLTHLSLEHNVFSGTIPRSIGGITYLRQFHAGYNIFTGVVPSTVGRLIYLEQLLLQENKLSGKLPVGLFSLKNMTMLYLSGNAITGTLPSEVGQLTNLRRLLLEDNELSGTIPSSVARITQIEMMYLHFNKLEGTMPETVCRMIKNVGRLIYLYTDCYATDGIDCDCCTDCCDDNRVCWSL